MRTRIRSFLWRHFPRAMLVMRYVRVFGRLPRLTRPRTFNEKMLIRLLFDRDPQLALFADKLAVRDYVQARLGGAQNLTTLYAAVDRAEAIADLDLPNRFIMKPNNSYRQIKVVKDLATTDRRELESLAASWLQRNYGLEVGEWAYQNISPRVVFEELLDEDGHGPTDYRIHCFDGEPKLVLVTRDIHGPDSNYTFYDVDFKMVPLKYVRTRGRYVAAQTEPPPKFREMLAIARKLSKGTDFLRVDLYNINGRIVFGELTNYPGGGVVRFEPQAFDETLGSYWSRSLSA